MRRKQRKEELIDSVRASISNRQHDTAELQGKRDIQDIDTSPLIGGEDLTGEFQQIQQVDSALWSQEHLGNAATASILTGKRLDRSPSLDVALNGRLPSDEIETLDETVKTEMENTFSHDFTGVRIHTGQSADAAAQKLQAHAFTIGEDIYFRQGEYDASTPQGQQLLGHELVHVAQQGDLATSAPYKVTTPGSTAEVEAEAVSGLMGTGGVLNIAPSPELTNTIAREVSDPSRPIHGGYATLYEQFEAEAMSPLNDARQLLEEAMPDYDGIRKRMEAIWEYLGLVEENQEWESYRSSGPTTLFDIQIARRLIRSSIDEGFTDFSLPGSTGGEPSLSALVEETETQHSTTDEAGAQHHTEVPNVDEHVRRVVRAALRSIANWLIEIMNPGTSQREVMSGD